MRILLLAGALALVSGCAVSPRVEAIAEAGYSIAQKAADDLLEFHERGICEATTRGSHVRRYGDKPAKLQAIDVLCAPASLIGAR